MVITDVEKAILNAIRDPEYIAYTPAFFAHYPPLKLVELVERTGFPMETISRAVDNLVQRQILRSRDVPPEWGMEGQPMKPFDFYHIGYDICDNDTTETICEQLDREQGNG